LEKINLVVGGDGLFWDFGCVLEKRMKVLIVMPYFFEPHRWMISGYKTALSLSKKIPIVVLTTGKPYYEELNPNLKIYRMRDLFIPDPVNFSFVPGLFWHLLKVIKKEKPNIFLVNKHMFYTSFSILWLRLLGKKVFTQIDTFPGIVWFSKSRFVNVILWLYSRTVGLLLLKLSDKVILLHEGLTPVAQRYGLNYTVIHNGVDFEEIKKAEPAPDLLSRKNDEMRIVYVGRLESVKGWQDLLKVALRVIKNNDKIKVYFVGSIKGKEDLVKRYQNKQIIFLGHREDIFSILKTMDIFVLPSYSEGLPNALMEAMACGLACTASNVGGAKILIQNNKNGLLFEPGNLKQLQSRILALVNNSDLRKRLGDNASSRIKGEYDIAKTAGRLLKLFKEEG
jgi:glycosyltransferase involved in cell wall biosynthesis